MKLIPEYDINTQSALDSLKGIISTRQNILAEKWDKLSSEVQVDKDKKAMYVYGKPALLAWYQEDSLIQQCRKEVERIIQISIPERYRVEED